MSSGGNPAVIFDQKDGSPIYVSRRELVLRYLMPVGDIYPFFKGLEEGRVLASRCVACGTLYFPPQSACPKCRGDKMEWVDVAGEGELLAYTQIVVRPKSFQNDPPYLVGVARMKEGFNVLAKLVAEDPKKVRVGARVRLTVERDKDGVPTYVLKQQVQ